MFDKFNNIIVDRKDGIATLTFNRPEAGNAFASESYGEVVEAMNLLGKDEETRVIVMTGKGRHFSAGGDINRFKMLIDTEEYLPREGVRNAGAMARSVKECPKPVISMVNGAASGAGCSVALAADFVVMEEKSRLIMSFIGMGFSADTGGLYFLMRSVGSYRASQMLMLGEQINGVTAHEWGICTKLAKDGELEDVAYALAKDLASRPTKGITGQKKLLNDFFFGDLYQFTEKEADYMAACGKTDDHAEAVNAFLEKRKPQFTGK